MAKRLQLRRGTTTQMSTFTGAVAEATFDTDKNTIIVHDGATVGGIELAKQSAVALKLDATATAVAATKLATARTFSLTGDVTATGVTFDGTANVSLTTVVADNSHNHLWSNITSTPTTLAGYGITDAIPSSQKGAANGVATLDATAKIPAAQLPAYVDDVLEYANLAAFPATGTAGVIYVALDTNKTYRWSGSAYIYITSGAVDSVAGKTGVVTLVPGDVGLGNVPNVDATNATNITTGTLDAARLPATIAASTTGNAATATKLATARSISLAGDVTGTVNFDGSANVSITATIAANSVALGTDTTGNYVAGATAGAGIAITGTAGEGWSPTVSLAASIDLGLVTDAIA